ncbi:MAG: transcription termination/antitermination protein NusA [Candidatus Hydrogenedentes bacterium]|nr:transcription termination/antitermination protein NusA [Candidatus Hydrogenedentota bacterium]
MADDLKIALEQIEKLKNVDRGTLLEAIRSAIEMAARKGITHPANITVEVDEKSLAFLVFEIRTVVEEVKDTSLEISLADALKLNPDVVVGNRLKVPTQPKDFGRIAAQTARQVIIQKLKDAERDRIYAEYKEREGDLVTGHVKRISAGCLFIGIGQVEAIVMPGDQSPRENYKVGDRIRAQVVKVEKTAKGTSVRLSRTSADLVRSLFEMEVPEIYDGVVEIRAISREAGSRTKVAVASKDPNVDPVGACVGLKGSRVRAVVEELSGEKIDIVRWSEDPVQFSINALNPADILRIHLNPETKSIQVIVPQDQLSLAIGKRGQNARLASRLMGWNIDIRGDSEGETPEQPAGAESGEDESGSADNDGE